MTDPFSPGGMGQQAMTKKDYDDWCEAHNGRRPGDQVLNRPAHRGQVRPTPEHHDPSVRPSSNHRRVTPSPNTKQKEQQ